MLQHTYSIFSANRRQVVPMTNMQKKGQLESHAQADLFNIFSKWATGCPNDYYAKKNKKKKPVGEAYFSIFSANRQQVVPMTIMQRKKAVSEPCSSRLIQYFQQTGDRLSRWLLGKEKRQLVSHALVHLFNILSKRATGCPDDYYEKKKVGEPCSNRLIQYHSKRAIG